MLGDAVPLVVPSCRPSGGASSSIDADRDSNKRRIRDVILGLPVSFSRGDSRGESAIVVYAIEHVSVGGL